jgi:outer membrane protein assembly factor BamB
VGSVSGAAAINANGDVVFGDDSGRVFAFHDDGMTFNCLWVFPQPESGPLPGPVVSSPAHLADPIDFSLVTAFIGVSTGHLEAINNFGTQQWRFPSGPGLGGPLSSSPASDAALLHITGADGFLYTLDRAGRPQHQARVSLPMADTDLLPSAMVGSSTYAVGTGGRCSNQATIGCLDQTVEELARCKSAAATCEDIGNTGMVTALTSVNEVRWRFATDAPIAGSAAFTLQIIDEPVLPTPTATPTGTRTEIIDPSTPTPTPTRLLSVVQGVVYIVDVEGTVYGVKDATGDVFAVKPTATATPTPTSTPGTDESPTPIPPDSRLTKVSLAAPADVTTSPVISSDLYVVFGTDAGALNAIRLDFERSAPCPACAVSQWQPIRFIDGDLGGGTIGIATAPVLSDPIIDRDGTIYVTAGDVGTGVGALYTVGSQ